ncbi:hypothetical protein Kpol_413p11 [Vanderwaltozyma polyspora DSM 70294]|uniref:Protein FMP42 n=1 Tax=Vanderwaltozyma polyspora (strain ATCC 22028 / DSM 70294 / BCRC 21397 / CBS 2163 / NBRC 10782 / NRRL Y-8283 / UCD 57-17) TaxID=436907 RepID=A7TRH6_VANPO|nr:uncharacterized protein Kpol_413p11 [Vanderwaltozyma polyspora DSM 70294]EDO15136.1 hypothetical protein Kpol_413p11 [Vanderwaltozyma polyspora DSM 70294]
MMNNRDVGEYLIEIACACIWSLFSSGIIFGFAALKPVLIKEGIYSELCKDDLMWSSEISSVPCTKQDLKLNNMFAVAATITNIIALPVGWILDYCGPRLSGIFGALFIALGGCNFIFDSSIGQYYDPYFVGFILLAVGGPFVFISCFHLSNIFPSRAGTIMALITGTFDSSSALFLIYRKMYERSNYSFGLQRFFKIYMIVPVFILICQIFIMPRDSYESPTPLYSSSEVIDPEEDTNAEGSEVPTEEDPLLESRSSRSRRKSSIETVAESRIFRHINNINGTTLHHESLKTQLSSPWFYLMLIFAAVCMVRINYFVATVKSQAEYLLGDEQLASKLNSIFDILLPLGGIVSIPIIGIILDHLQSLRVLLLLTTVSIIIGICGLIPNSFEINLIGVILFVVYRPFYYTVVSDYTSKTFGFQTFGTVYGLLTCICGICNMTQTYLDNLTHTNFSMNPTPVNITLLTLTVISATALITFIHREQPNHTPITNFRHSTQDDNSNSINSSSPP